MLGLWHITSHDMCISWDRLLECVRFDVVKVILYIAISFHKRAVKDTKLRGLFQEKTFFAGSIFPQIPKAWHDRIDILCLEIHALCVIVA